LRVIASRDFPGQEKVRGWVLIWFFDCCIKTKLMVNYFFRFKEKSVRLSQCNGLLVSAYPLKRGDESHISVSISGDKELRVLFSWIEPVKKVDSLYAIRENCSFGGVKSDLFTKPLVKH
jgi:hypothetical protein